MQAEGADSGPAHLLVADADERLRDLLKRYLSRHGFLVSGARDAAHARRLLQGLAFDVVIADAALPGGDVTAHSAGAARAPVLLLTSQAARPPADPEACLAKPFEPRDLLLRVSALLLRAAPAPRPDAVPRVLTLGETRFDVRRAELRRGGDLVRLTSTEQALMRVFSDTPGEAVSRARLAEELGGSPGAAVQERAVDVQITRLRRKIEADPRSPRYLQTVRGAGYALVPD